MEVAHKQIFFCIISTLQIMQARKQRVIQEPEDDCWRIKVKCEDGTSRVRKFKKKAVYQVSNIIQSKIFPHIAALQNK